MPIDYNSLDDGQQDTVDMIRNAAATYGVNPDLAVALANQESGFRHYDVNKNPETGNVLTSPKGARGVFQLMPTTASGALGVNPDIEAENIDGGVRYLRGLLDKYQGSVPHALAAYNGGPEVGDAFAQTGIPPAPGTETFKHMQGVASNFDIDNAPGLIAPGATTPQAGPTKHAAADVSLALGSADNPSGLNIPTSARIANDVLGASIGAGGDIVGEVIPNLLGYGKNAIGNAVKGTIKSAMADALATPASGAAAAPPPEAPPPKAAPTAAAPPPEAPPPKAAPTAAEKQARILQGGDGDTLGSTGRARQTGYNANTQTQATNAKVMRGAAVSPAEAEAARLMPAPGSTDSGVLAPRSALSGDPLLSTDPKVVQQAIEDARQAQASAAVAAGQARAQGLRSAAAADAQAAAAAQAAHEAEIVRLTELANTERLADAARRAAPAAKSGLAALVPSASGIPLSSLLGHLVSRGLAGAGLADAAQTGWNAIQSKDTERLGTSALTGLGSGMMLFPPTAPLGAGLALAGPAIQYGLDYINTHKSNEPIVNQLKRPIPLSRRH